MDVTIVASPTAPHQVEHAQALAEGLRRHGIRVVTGRRWPARTRTVACWGWRLGSRFRRMGHEVLVMERGYLGDRFKWASLGWNGLNGRAKFPSVDDPSRFQRHFAHLMKPWRSGGDYALLIGQVPRDVSIRGVNMNVWYADTAGAMGMPVRFRPHPFARAGQTVPGTTLSQGSLQEALDGAAVTLTYNSNTGVDSVMAGVPVTVADHGSMAWPVAGRLGEIVRPDREQWASRLAWCQWTLDEIRSGEAWEVVGGKAL
jgi:hypothetical protein